MSQSLNLSINEESLDNPEEKKMFTIVCSDNKTFTIETQLLYLSHFFKSALESDTEAKEIVLNDKISSYAIGKVVEYLNYYHLYPQKIIEVPLISNDLETLVGKWYSNFAECNNNMKNVFDVLFVSNYLDIKPLLQLMCTYISLIMKKKNIHQIKNDFGIINKKLY